MMLLVAMSTGVTACGGGPRSFGHQRTVLNLRDCLAVSNQARDAAVLDRSVLRSAPGARDAVEVRFGGPTDKNGTIAELPVLADALYVFDSPLAAVRGRLGLRGAPGHPVVETLGRVAIAHTVASLEPVQGLALSPGEREAIRRCLRATGYLR